MWQYFVLKTSGIVDSSLLDLRLALVAEDLRLFGYENVIFSSLRRVKSG